MSSMSMSSPIRVSLIVVDIDHTDQSVALLSEIVQERRILSERRIAVVRAIEGAVVVAE